MTKAQRMAVVLAMLCTDQPPIDLCRAWLDGDEDRYADLQDWIGMHMREEMAWALTITIAEAAANVATEIQPADAAIRTGTEVGEWEL